jgi:hypothetical protein
MIGVTMPISEMKQRRTVSRKKSDVQVIRLQIQDRLGNPRWVTADLLDASESGIGISVMTPLAVGAKIAIRGKLGENRGDAVCPATVRWCTEKINGNFHAGLEFDDRSASAPHQSQPASVPIEELDCYEAMQLSPNASVDTIHRVYRILAQRYHPDTPETGNREIFLRVCEAHGILSDPEKRASYDARHRETKQLHWKIFDRAEAAHGPEAERRKRQGILELLYAKTVHNPEHASMTVFEFEDLLGCPREHLEAALWYLKGKDYVRRGDNGRFSITVAGFDEAESHAASGEPRNLKLLPAGTAAD